MKKIINAEAKVKPRYICAIDSSTNSLAFSIFDENKLISYGKINFAGNNVFSKVADASRKTGALLEKFNIDAIVIEHSVYMNSPKTMADLAMLQGSLLGSAGRSGIRTAGAINPITWQTFIGNGKLKPEDRKKIIEDHPDKSKSFHKKLERELRKTRTLNFVNTYYDIDVKDDDVADAIGVGHYAINNWSKIEKG